MNLQRNSIKQSLENFKENGVDEIWAADLIDVQAFSKGNSGIK